VNGGSFAVTAARAKGRLAAHQTLIAWFISQERRLALQTPAPFRRFEERVFEHRTHLVELIRTLRDGGATIMVDGAPTQAKALLQFCGFGPQDIEAMAEVNEDKFGHVTPGTRIPIISEAEMRTRRPDYLIVFPWHFREGIVSREQA